MHSKDDDYLMRRPIRNDNAAKASLVGLALVLVTGVSAAWWSSHATWGDVSPIYKVLPYIIYTQPSSNVEDPTSGPVVVEAPEATSSAPYCRAQEAPSFSNEFNQLSQRLGARMGWPVSAPIPIEPMATCCRRRRPAWRCPSNRAAA